MITITRILCPVDFFPASDAAFNYAVGLAANYDARIHLLHVISPLFPTAYEYAINTGEIMNSLEKNAAEEMNVLVKRAKDAGVCADTEIRIGDVYEEIKYALEAERPELLVMGTHGRRGVERWFMGSTTEKLLRHSPVPMVTIRATGEKGVDAHAFPADPCDNGFFRWDVRRAGVCVLGCTRERFPNHIAPRCARCRGRCIRKVPRFAPERSGERIVGSRAARSAKLVRGRYACRNGCAVSDHFESIGRREYRSAGHEHPRKRHARPGAAR